MKIPKGRLLIIGGKEDKEGVNSDMEKNNSDFIPNEILKLLAKSKDNRIEIITTASEEPEEVPETYSKTLEEIGYTNFNFLDISDQELHSDHHRKRIKAAKTIFFSGGDQNRIFETLKKSVLHKMIREKFENEEDFTIAGTSAGAMCIPDLVILEADNGEAMLEDDIEIAEGWGFLKNCIVDTHFVHRARFGRLAHAVMLNPNCWGIGLGEDSALIINEGKTAVCIGSGMVWMINGSEIKQTNVDSAEKCSAIYAENLKVHILSNDCTFDLEKNIFTGTEENGN
ncbi:hypothetical protein ASG01_00235 [Chryseobacterium sp. Leaf180]|uniref:cyanophycinase n=1 Tax=Chryseobacterium sp. Leaf180 TaxID=1736289 RepID=UPI0006FD0086|nr:cyanophycinase [Chryseobacterium sp. Leaf180]KQR94353.1 hypothetical protein ASG01_00235 [Chryseobacterium sp. Leaf180]